MNDFDYVSKSVQEIPEQSILPIVQRTAQLCEISDDSEEEDILPQYERDEITGPIRSAHEIPLKDLEVGEIPAEISPQIQIIPAAFTQYYSGDFTIARSVEIKNRKNKGISPGTLLCDANHNPITRVLDLFGPIENPQIILKGHLPLKTDLYAVVESESVFPDPDLISKQFPGCDASNRYDEEAPNQDFSDDEEEREYKKRSKNQKKVKVVHDQPTVGYPRT